MILEVFVPMALTALVVVADAAVSVRVAKAELNGRALFFIYAILFLLVNSSGVLAVAVLVLFAIFYATNLLNYSFYKSGLQPELMVAIFSEHEDIFLALGANRLKNLFLCVVATGLFLVIAAAQQRLGGGGVWPALFMLVFFSVQGLKAKDILKFKPRKDLSVFENTFRAFQGFIFHGIPSYFSGNGVKYVELSEKIEPVDAPDREVVVLVIGESVSSFRVSACGYAHDTTPFLSRIRREGSCIFRDGYSSATSTVSAMTALLLGLNDPRDINALRGQEGNLFRLAKKSGFRTHYFSAQRSNVVDRVDVNDVDDFHSIDTNPDISKEGELAILSLLDELSIGERHFVVIQMRIGHAPYDYYKKILPDLPDTTRDPNSLENYENSVRGTDWLFEKIVMTVSSLSTKYDIYFTSDHGELFGEGGLYGHAMLSLDASRVPLCLVSSDDNPAAVQFLSRYSMTNHYDLSCAVAISLGWRLTREGEEKGYINGIGFAGSSGLLDYSRVMSS